MLFSAAVRSAIRPAKVTVTGCATPTVTPVGEMPTYVRHMETGLIWSNKDQAAADVARLLDDPALFTRISAA